MMATCPVINDVTRPGAALRIDDEAMRILTHPVEKWLIISIEDMHEMTLFFSPNAVVSSRERANASRGLLD